MKIKKFNESKIDDLKIDKWMGAISDNNISVVKSLIKDGFPVDYEEGWTALIWAAKNNSIEMIDVLMDAGANVNKMVNDGMNALTKAAQWGNLDVVKHLIEKYKAKIPKRKNPLIFAASRDHVDVVKYLIEHGADYRIKGENNMDCYDRALRSQANNVAEWIEKNLPEFVEERVIRRRANKFGL